MNELQREEVDLLKIFIDFCEKHELKYYLVCGSALGAVKYKGFIPWDDDIDVGMPRDDYEILLTKMQKELPENLFLQNYRTDRFFPHVYSKLRNTKTTFIEKNVAHLKINHGIYIDIFPLDGYPVNRKEKEFFELKKKVLNWMHYCALNNKSSRKVALRDWFFRLFGYHKRTSKALARLDALISSYNTDNSEIWCNHGNWQGELEYAPKIQYGDGIEAEFEGIKVIIPEHYDEYLTQKYGDWRSDPPADKQRTHHSVEVCDIKKSYLEYVRK